MKAKIKTTALVVTGVAVLAGAGLVSANHYQNNKKPSELEALREENSALSQSLKQADADNVAHEQKAVQVRVECEKGAVAYSYLTSYQKRLIGQAPTCPPMVATPQN